MEQQQIILWVLGLFILSNAVTGLLTGFFVYKLALAFRGPVTADNVIKDEENGEEAKGGSTAYNIDDLDGAVPGVHSAEGKKNILSELLERRNDKFVNQLDEELSSLAMGDNDGNEHA